MLIGNTYPINGVTTRNFSGGFYFFYVNVNVIFIVNRGVNVVMNLRVENKKITDLKPAPYNPRLDLQPGDPDYEKLKRSIQEFGLVEPIVFNERTGYVVGGHQ